MTLIIPTVHTATANRPRVLRLAAATGLDPRTIARALRDGIDSIRVHRAREAIRAALAAEGGDDAA